MEGCHSMLEAISPEALSRLAASIQPLVFETEIPEFPYATKGTVFLVGYKGRAFVLTARHALGPDRLSPVCVFPSDASQRILPLKDVLFVPEAVVPDDYVDLAVIEIDVANIEHEELGKASLIDMALASGEWLPHAHSSGFVILGFPEEHSFVDYAAEEIGTVRIAMAGRYCKPSSIEHLHELEIVDAPPLSTYSGFSGSPVFALIAQPDGGTAITLCGMALRGDASSRRVHFLDSSVLLDALEAKRRATNAI